MIENTRKYRVHFRPTNPGAALRPWALIFVTYEAMDACGEYEIIRFHAEKRMRELFTADRIFVVTERVEIEYGFGLWRDIRWPVPSLPTLSQTPPFGYSPPEIWP